MDSVGILFALGALVCWGFGDFLIQKETRLAGIWQTLFYNTLITAVVLAPFTLGKLSLLKEPEILKLLFFTAGITLLVVWVECEAFRRGKLAVVEPIMSFELPFTVLLGVTLGAEKLNVSQILLIGAVFCGIFILAYRKTDKRSLLERGAILALLSAVVMAGVNFFTGSTSQEIGPVFTIWFIDILLLVGSIVILLFRKETKTIIPHFTKNPISAILMAVFDNAAWLFFAASVMLIPISIAITISEGYIILAVLLGVFINREKIRRYQWVGVLITVVSVITLGFIS